MLIIPAIDLHGGRCVRLIQGKREKETVYSHNPVEVALKWEADGASCLHLVDLDGAFGGEPVNLGVVKDIAASVNLPLQLGGGMRSRETVDKVLAAGVAKVILGTAAVEKPDFVAELVKSYGRRIVAGIDARDGIVAVRGWVEGSGKKAVDLALKLQELGLGEIIYTDIARDGTLEGPNIQAMETMAKALHIPVIASGGVSSLDDLRRLKELSLAGISGVIVGQALYAGRFTLPQALAVMAE